MTGFSDDGDDDDEGEVSVIWWMRLRLLLCLERGGDVVECMTKVSQKTLLCYKC